MAELQLLPPWLDSSHHSIQPGQRCHHLCGNRHPKRCPDTAESHSSVKLNHVCCPSPAGLSMRRSLCDSPPSPASCPVNPSRISSATCFSGPPRAPRMIWARPPCDSRHTDAETLRLFLVCLPEQILASEKVMRDCIPLTLT